MWEKILMWLMPKLKEALKKQNEDAEAVKDKLTTSEKLEKKVKSLDKKVGTLKKRLDAEMLARKNEVNRVEKEVSKDWVGDEIESAELQDMITTLDNNDIVDEDKLP